MFYSPALNISSDYIYWITVTVILSHKSKHFFVFLQIVSFSFNISHKLQH